MLAYPKHELYNVHVTAEASEALNRSDITEEEFAKVKKAYPVTLYSPGAIVRVGLGLLTIFILLLSIGLMILMFQVYNSLPGFSIFFGLLCYGMLEVMAGKKHFNSGVDNMLMVASVSFIAGGVAADLSFETYSSAVTISCLLFLMCSYLCLRFTDRLMALIAGISFLSLIFFTYLSIASTSLNSYPFVLVIFSASLYFSAVRLYNMPQTFYYRQSLFVLRILALFAFYASGNFYVVSSLHQYCVLPFNVAKPVDFGFLFWFWTMAIPLFYIGKSIVSKDQVMLRTGLILIAAAVLTFRYYYAILSPEAAMFVAGLLLVAISYAFIKLLKKPAYGFCFEKPAGDEDDNANIEGWIVSEVTAGKTAPEQEGGYGGGSFGGAGAGDKY